MNRRLISSLIFLLLLHVPACSSGGGGFMPPGKQTVCPYMGDNIVDKYYIDVQKRRIYLCCSGCVKTAQKDPEGLLSRLEKAGVILTPTPEQ